MTDMIIGAVVVLGVAAAVISVIRKAKRKASCCGSGSYVAKSRKLKHVVQKKTFRVEGMHCQNCANRVVEDVQDLPHVSASVQLKKGLVVVSMEVPVEDVRIKAAIEKHGYTATEVL